MGIVTNGRQTWTAMVLHTKPPRIQLGMGDFDSCDDARLVVGLAWFAYQVAGGHFVGALTTPYVVPRPRMCKVA